MEINKPDAVVSDLDGTLVTVDQRIGERDRAAILRLSELGVPVLPGTGRPPINARGVVRKLGLELALCSNGGCCYDFSREETVFARYMETDVARRLIGWLRERELLFIIHTPPRTYRSPGAEVVPRYDVSTAGDEPLCVLTPEISLDELQILKILVVECDERQVMAEMAKDFAEGELTTCSSQPTFVDCSPPGVTKGFGLRRLAEVKGWRLENILAMGDNFNDQEMLEAAGKSAVPADGVAEMRALAGFVTAPCGEDPLAAALDHFYPELLAGI